MIILRTLPSYGRISEIISSHDPNNKNLSYTFCLGLRKIELSLKCTCILKNKSLFIIDKKEVKI